MTRTHRVLGTDTTDSLADYLDGGGGAGLVAARRSESRSIIDTVERSGLRGRGGAGFPTGRKWRTLADVAHTNRAEIPVIVNAAEGEPGTFKDRSLLRVNPYLVLEGAAIAARAVGSTQIIVAIKTSFSVEIDRIRTAIDEIEAAAWLPGFTIELTIGPSEYLFGEETAMLEVIDGRAPFPRVAPPYRRGVDDRASHHSPREWGSDGRRGDGAGVLVDNVETLANVVGIVANGADWFREIGTADSPGTVICTVTGATDVHGVGEFAMGTTVREVINALGSGSRSGRRISAVLNGVSNPPLSAEQLDTPLTYEDMAAIGSGLGSASLIVVDDSTSLLAVAAGVARFLAIESCGQCEPCKRDGLELTTTLGAATRQGRIGDRSPIADRLSTVARGARCALAGQTERIVGRLVELAASQQPKPDGIYPIVPLVEINADVAVYDVAHLEKRSDWTFPGDGHFSNAWPVERLADQPVEITTGHSISQRKPTDAPTPSPRFDGDSEGGVFDTLTELDERLTRRLDELRASVPGERQHLLSELRADLEQYQRVTERFVYPALERLDDHEGDEIAWYPEHHTQAAARLIRSLDLGTLAVSPRLIDQLCADVHISISEVRLRVLPLIEQALRSVDIDPATVAAGVDELLEP